VVALLAQVSAAFQPGLKHTGAYLASTVVLALVVGTVVLLPWARMPRWSQVSAPLGLAVWVGRVLASQRTVDTGLTPLVLLPILWAALYHRPWEAALVVTAAIEALELDSVIKHDPASVLERRAVLWAMLAALVVVSALNLRRRLVGAILQREEALRQAELLGAATRELNTSLDPDQVVATACRLAAEIASSQRSAAWRGSFYGLDGDQVRIDAQFDPSGATVSEGWPLRKHPVLLDAVHTGNSTCGALVPEQLGPTVRKMISSAGITHGAWVPIMTRGDLYGVLALASRGEAISTEQLSRCADVGRILELALNNAFAHRQDERRGHGPAHEPAQPTWPRAAGERATRPAVLRSARDRHRQPQESQRPPRSRGRRRAARARRRGRPARASRRRRTGPHGRR
jgi:hypothetical protein